MKKQSIIIDTDAGIDDAMALFLALRSVELNVVGITSVYGNTYVENTTRNILRVLSAVNREDIPVAVGANGPLTADLSPRSGRFHAPDGLGEAARQLRRSHQRPIKTPAAQFIQEMIMKNPGQITLATLGPLTNLAMAFRLRPEITKCVKRVVVLGGAIGIPGNATPVAEANFHEDPLAARIVLSAPWKVVLVGLNATTKVPMTRTYISALCRRQSPETIFISKIIPFYQHAYELYHQMGGTVYCHDATLIAYLTHPHLFRVQEIPLYMETEGRAAGMTIPDRAKRWADSTTASVCMSVEGTEILALYKRRVGSLGSRPRHNPKGSRTEPVKKTEDNREKGGSNMDTS